MRNFVIQRRTDNTMAKENFMRVFFFFINSCTKCWFEWQGILHIKIFVNFNPSDLFFQTKENRGITLDIKVVKSEIKLGGKIGLIHNKCGYQKQ